MCDTAVALKSITKDGCTFFAKNSDRDPNEAQYLQIVKGGRHSAGDKVKCTYREIPQVDQTYSVLISRPFWMWGAEMGVNENGVAIGNEAVFTRIPPKKEPGLIGMDLLRLALERSKTSEEALHVLIDLLGKYGQSGNCSIEHQLYYHNSFLIADRDSAWVLETADRHWAAIKVKDYYTISNKITITDRWDLASEDLIHFAVDKKWCRSKEDFNFSKCYSDLLFSTFSQAQKRSACSRQYLESRKRKIDTGTMISMLRLHDPDVKNWRIDQSLTEWTLCVHKGFGPIRASQSVGSLVSRLGEHGDIHFATGTSAPCLSMFKPIWMDVGLPDIGLEPKNTFNEETLWWQHELLHREVLKDFSYRSELFKDERNQIESDWIDSALKMGSSDKNKRGKFSDQAFTQSRELSQKWLNLVRSQQSKSKSRFYYQMEWQKQNSNAKIPV